MNKASSTGLSKIERLVVLGGVGVHFALTLVVFSSSFLLVSTGAVNLLVGLLWVVGLVCLYLAALRVALGRVHPVRLLGVAAFCLAVSAFKFGLPYPPAVVAALGAVIAVVAVVVTHPWFSGRAANGG